MAPVEWPIAERSGPRAETSARLAVRDRLSAVRADFFLDPEATLAALETADGNPAH